MPDLDPDGHYAMLGVQPTATPSLIKAAYRVRAMELHPDRNPDSAATHAFQRLQKAFDVLSDPAARALYDARAGHWQRPPPPPAPAPEPPPYARAAAVRQPPPRRALPWVWLAGGASVAIVALAAWLIVGPSQKPLVVSPAAKAASPVPARATAPVVDAPRHAAVEQPTPRTGIVSRRLPDSLPPEADLPPFKVTAPPSAHYLIKLIDARTERTTMTLFVRADESLEVGVPPGRYRVRVAAGSSWFGDAQRFGPDTAYWEAEQAFEFSVRGGQLVGRELRLASVANGNLRRKALRSSGF